MKLVLWCSIAALLGVILAKCMFGQVADVNRVLVITGALPGQEPRNWMYIDSQNGRNWRNAGYDPRLTRIFCDYMPMFRQLPNGKYEIMFYCPFSQ